jgi:hypothetical protein
MPDLLRECGMSRSALFEVLAGRSRPHAKNQEKLTPIARKWIELEESARN